MRLTSLASAIALLLVFSAPAVAQFEDRTGRDGWVLSAPFRALGLHASGDVVWAWSDYQITVSSDGGQTWSAPFAPPTDEGRPVRIMDAVAASRGGLVRLENGLVYSAVNGDWVQVDLNGVSQLVGDGAGGVWAVRGPTGQLALVDPSGGFAERGTGRILFSTADGVVVESGGAVRLVRASDEVSLRWSGGAAYLPGYFDLPAQTSALNGVVLARNGVQWQVRDGRVDNSLSLPGTMAHAVAASDGRTFALVTAENVTYLLYRSGGRLGDWSVYPRLPTIGMPVGNPVSVTVSSNYIVVATDQGLSFTERRGERG